MKYWLTRDWLLLLSEAHYITWHPAVMYPEITKCTDTYRMYSLGKQKKEYFWAKDRLISRYIIVYGIVETWANRIEYIILFNTANAEDQYLLQPLSRLTRETSLARTSYVKYYLSSEDIICRSRNVMNRRKALRNSILSLS